MAKWKDAMNITEKHQKEIGDALMPIMTSFIEDIKQLLEEYEKHYKPYTIITYISCDGIENTEVIQTLEVYEYIDFLTGEDKFAFLCTRLNGDEFEVDFDKVIEYKRLGD